MSSIHSGGFGAIFLESPPSPMGPPSLSSDLHDRAHPTPLAGPQPNDSHAYTIEQSNTNGVLAQFLWEAQAHKVSGRYIIGNC